MASLASASRSLFSLCIYCISGLSATWSSLGYSLPEDHVTQTTTPPLSFYISLTHSLSLFCSLRVPLFFPLVTHCHSLFYLLHPPRLALALFLPFSLSSRSPLLSHFLCYLLPVALSSDLASLWPAPSIPSLPPQLSTHLSMVKKTPQPPPKKETPLSSAVFDTKKQHKRPRELRGRECAIFNLLRSDTSLKHTAHWTCTKKVND